jgi:hypothetical protein
MSAQFVASYLVKWGLIGAALFVLYVIFVFRSGLVYAARKPDGTLKDQVPLSGRLAMGSFIVIIIGFLVCANMLGLDGIEKGASFWTLFFLNYALYAILFSFDTFFIDAFVLGFWRPKFLKVPEEMGRESMKQHILKSIPVGLVVGVVLAGLSTWISRLLYTH